MALSAGDRLGAYTLLAPMPTSGMAEVWRARDTRLNRDVAVKVIKDELASDVIARERFLREARSIASLSHPNILDIHDVGPSEGRLWFVTELLEGETVKERLENGPIPWRRAVEIAVAISDGLSAAHVRGIIHRDIKPSNVFLTSDGRVKVLDFGIAALTDEASVPAAARDLTAPQTLVGTAGYLAPEQIRRDPVDARCDLFALGCVLYEMLTGRRAFSGDTSPESLVATLRSDPKDPADLVPELPSDLRALVLRCLEKRPDRRFQTAADLSEALRRPFAPTTRPSELSPASGETDVLVPPAPARPRRRGALAAAVLVAVLAAAAAGGAAFYLVRRSGLVDSIVVLPFVSDAASGDDAFLADAFGESLRNAAARLPDMAVYRCRDARLDPRRAARDVHARAALTGSVSRRGPEIVVQAELVDERDGRLIWMERLVRPAPAAGTEDELAASLVRRLRPDAAAAKPRGHDPAAWDRVQRGRFFLNRRTPDGIAKAQELFQEAAALDPKEAEAYRGLAEVFHLMAYYGVAAPATLIPEQRKFASRAISLDPSLSGPYAILADARYMFDHDWPGAEEDFKRALVLNPSDAEARQWYSNFLTASSRFEEAAAQIRRARELDPLNAVIQMDAGLAHHWAGDPAAAEKEIRGAIELDPTNPLPRIWIALPILDSNRAADALKDLQKAPDQPFVLALRGYAFARLGRNAEAEAARRALDALAKEEYVGGIAYAILALGERKTAAALDALERAANDGEGMLTYLEVERAFDPLRSEARFRALVKRLGIPPSRR